MGRKLIRHPDGRVTTYRKTMIRRTRRPTAPQPALRPEEMWTLSFHLPGMLGLGFTGFYPGIASVECWPPDRIQIKGASTDYCHRQALAFLRKIAPQGIAGFIPVEWIKPLAPSPTRRQQDFVSSLVWDGRTLTAQSATAMRAIA